MHKDNSAIKASGRAGAGWSRAKGGKMGDICNTLHNKNKFKKE